MSAELPDALRRCERTRGPFDKLRATAPHLKPHFGNPAILAGSAYAPHHPRLTFPLIYDALSATLVQVSRAGARAKQDAPQHLSNRAEHCHGGNANQSGYGRKRQRANNHETQSRRFWKHQHRERPVLFSLSVIRFTEDRQGTRQTDTAEIPPWDTRRQHLQRPQIVCTAHQSGRTPQAHHRLGAGGGHRANNDW